MLFLEVGNDQTRFQNQYDFHELTGLERPDTGNLQPGVSTIDRRSKWQMMARKTVQELGSQQIEQNVHQILVDIREVAIECFILKTRDENQRRKSDGVPHDLSAKIRRSRSIADQVKRVVDRKTTGQKQDDENQNKSEVTSNCFAANLKRLFHGCQASFQIAIVFQFQISYSIELSVDQARSIEQGIQGNVLE